MQTTITTIGTSLLTNPDRPWAGWRFGQSPPEPATVDAWLRSADLKRASAETHTWLKLGILEETERHRLVLVHTNTADGRYCAQRLKTWADRHGIDCSVEQIENLGTAREDRFNLGLAELARKLSVSIANARARGGTAGIAATGGFKAEIAVANLVGALLDAPVHYVYERFERLVTLEPLPIDLNLDGLRAGCGAALLDRVAAADGALGLRRSEIAGMLRQDPRLDLYLETTEYDGEEYAILNPIGEIARRQLDAPAVEWPPETERSPADKRILQKGHERPKGWEGVVDKLARNAYVTLVRYDDRLNGKHSRMGPAAGSDTEIAVLIAEGATSLGLRVSTTARTAAERDRVLRHLAARVRL